jgi:hypothetical protein
LAAQVGLALQARNPTRTIVRATASDYALRANPTCALTRPTGPLIPVIPAQAGIQSGGGSRDVRCWTPAFAGVTGRGMPGIEDPAGSVTLRSVRTAPAMTRITVSTNPFHRLQE